MESKLRSWILNNGFYIIFWMNNNDITFYRIRIETDNFNTNLRDRDLLSFLLNFNDVKKFHLEPIVEFESNKKTIIHLNANELMCLIKEVKEIN